MTVINENFCFNPYANLTADISNKALRKYAESFEIAKALGGDFPIVLDTNILLGYYGMSQNEKGKLIKFITTYKDRIYITKQVEQEYLRNRLSVIKKDFFGPLNKIEMDFVDMRNEISGKLQSFRENKKKILSQDYHSLWDDLKRIEEEIKATLYDENFFNEIIKQVGTTTQNNKNIVYIDELLDLTSNLNITSELTETELTYVRQLFEKLVADYNQAKENIRWKHAIPGCGDQKEDASGDFIIFHEILKLMKQKGSSCIFLTNDVTKGDWLQKDKTPHNHYLELAYNLTENIVYIIHAEQTLPYISFENIHKPANVEFEDISEVDDISRYESTIVTIDTNKGFGFILNTGQNLYFNYAEYDGNFEELHKNDIVTFEKGSNLDGKPVAKNVRKVSYSFNPPSGEIKREIISHINHYRGIGFINNQPENLYFHQAFMTNPEDFNKLQVGDLVEFIEGKNADGEKIARLVRLFER